MNKLWSLLGLSIGLVLAISACGGSDKPSATGAAASQPGGSAVNVLDLQKSAATLDTLQSFRFDLSLSVDTGQSTGGSSSMRDQLLNQLAGKLGSITAQGAFVAPEDSEIKAVIGGEQMGLVQTGGRAWVNDGSGWEETDALHTGRLTTKASDLLNGFVPGDVLKGAKTSRESVNGVQATRYSFDKQALTDLITSIKPKLGANLQQVTSANLDVWLSDSNVPLRVKLSASGQTDNGRTVSVQFDLNVTNVNDPSIVIKALNSGHFV